MAERMLHEPQEPFGPANPHPAYGKDPNVANEFGHTIYPKMVQTATGSYRAEDEDEETELLEKHGAPPKPEKATSDKPIKPKNPKENTKTWT